MRDGDSHLLSKKYKQLIAHLPCGICAFAMDEVLAIIYANELYYNLYGYTMQEAEQAGFTNLQFVLASSAIDKLNRDILHVCR